MKFNRIVLVSIILLILAIGAVSATDENMTGTADEVLSAEASDEVFSAEPAEELEASQGDFTELSNLVKGTSSGGTLYLEKDYVRNGLSSYISLSKEITIDGQGHTIDANRMDSFGYVFYCKYDAHNVVLKNINFINGASQFIYVSSDTQCSIYDCSFVNYSGSYYGAINGPDSGTRCSVYDCRFVNCHSDVNGGAIFRGNAYNCSFVNCSANYGGAIYQGDAYNSSFMNCYADYMGGAIYGKAYDSTFINCTTKDSDAAIYGNTASNCTFINCKDFAAIHSIHAEDIDYGYSGSTSIAIYGTTNAGYANVTLNGQTKKVKLSNPAYISAQGLNAGTYDVIVVYDGNGNFEAQTVTATFNVAKINPINKISARAENSAADYGTNVDYTTLNSILVIGMNKNNVPGNVRVTVNGETQQVSATGNTLKVPLGVLKAGPYNIQVRYAGNVNFNAQTETLSFNIIGVNPITGMQINSPYIPEDKKNVRFAYTSARLIINLFSNKLTEDLNITVDGVSKTVNPYGSYSITVPLGILKLGQHDIKVSYSGNDNINAQTKTMSFKVNKCLPINYIRIYNYQSNGEYLNKEVPYDGENPTLTIHMISERVSGNVHVTVDGASHQTVKITDSFLNVPLNILRPGVHEIKVSYAGSAYCEAQDVTISITVVKGTPVSYVNVSSPVGFGNDVIITANMKTDKINGNVWYTISDENNTKLLTDKIHIENGVANKSISGLSIGKYKLHVYYAGNSNYNAQTIKDAFEIVKGTPIESVNVSNWAPGKDVTIEAKVKNLNGNVWFTITDANRTTVFSNKSLINDGQAIISVPGLSVGSYNLNAYYAGNANYNAQSVKTSFEVTKISPELSVAKTTVDGKTVLTASIAEDARGNVKFEVGGIEYKAQIVKGVATLTLPDMAPGTYTLKSSYGGNYKYLAETKTRTITIK